MNATDLLPPDITQEDPVLDDAAQLEKSARTLDLEDWIVQRLKRPEREITVNLPLRRDGGDAIASVGYRVQQFRARAGCLGPVLFAPDAHLAILRPLAVHLTLQCALFDLPFGGSAGAIVCDPAQLSEADWRRIVRDYLAALRDVTRPDVFAPAEFVSAWTNTRLDLASAAVVGKPAAVGGLPDPHTIIAAGWLTLVSRALATSDQPLDTIRVALQGFGPSAAALARVLRNAGARIIGLADNSGGLFAERGLDLDAIDAHAQAHGMLYGFAEAEPVRNSEVLEAGCDVLITAAAERQINAQNASRIRAAVVLEAVPNAVTPAAASILVSRGVQVIPALLGTAPQTLAWFAEWQSGLRYCAPEQSETESMIRHKLAELFQRVQSSADINKVSLPDACRTLALEKLSRVLRLTAD